MKTIDKPIYIPNVNREQLPKVRELHELHTRLRKENKDIKQDIQRLLIMRSDYKHMLEKKDEEILNLKKVLYDYIEEVKELRDGVSKDNRE